jgi:hypothetical protein
MNIQILNFNGLITYFKCYQYIHLFEFIKHFIFPFIIITLIIITYFMFMNFNSLKLKLKVPIKCFHINFFYIILHLNINY